MGLASHCQQGVGNWNGVRLRRYWACCPEACVACGHLRRFVRVRSCVSQFTGGLERRRTWDAGPATPRSCLLKLCPQTNTVGLDNSESFLRLAQKSASERLSFLLHDITTGPFPSGPFDLLFSRFELTHLRESDAVVMLWGEQLNVHGLLLIEEVERVETNIAVLRTYLDMQQAMLRDQGKLPVHRTCTRPNR